MAEFLNKEITIQALQEGLFQLEKLWGAQCMAGAIHPKMIERKRAAYNRVLNALKKMDATALNELTTVEKENKQPHYKNELFNK